MGLKIRNIRKQLGFTQEKLCEMLDIDISGLSKIENGKCFPSTETIYKLINNLDISPLELFNSSSSKTSAKDDLTIEKLRQLSIKDREKIIKIVDIINS